MHHNQAYNQINEYSIEDKTIKERNTLMIPLNCEPVFLVKRIPKYTSFLSMIGDPIYLIVPSNTPLGKLHWTCWFNE